MNCPKCGVSLPDGTELCPSCGAPLTKSAKSDLKKLNNNASVPKKKDNAGAENASKENIKESKEKKSKGDTAAPRSEKQPHRKINRDEELIIIRKDVLFSKYLYMGILAVLSLAFLAGTFYKAVPSAFAEPQYAYSGYKLMSFLGQSSPLAPACIAVIIIIAADVFALVTAFFALTSSAPRFVKYSVWPLGVISLGGNITALVGVTSFAKNMQYYYFTCGAGGGLIMNLIISVIIFAFCIWQGVSDLR